jgi:hypothetical protein
LKLGSGQAANCARKYLSSADLVHLGNMLNGVGRHASVARIGGHLDQNSAASFLDG